MSLHQRPILIPHLAPLNINSIVTQLKSLTSDLEITYIQLTTLSLTTAFFSGLVKTFGLKANSCAQHAHTHAHSPGLAATWSVFFSKKGYKRERTYTVREEINKLVTWQKSQLIELLRSCYRVLGQRSERRIKEWHNCCPLVPFMPQVWSMFGSTGTQRLKHRQVWAVKVHSR